MSRVPPPLPPPRSRVRFSVTGRNINEIRANALRGLVGLLGVSPENPKYTLEISPLVHLVTEEPPVVWTAEVTAWIG